MKLEELIPRLPQAPVISIAGAGGKTTLMFRLAEMLPAPCVVTTTAKVGKDQIRFADCCSVLSGFSPENPLKRMWVSPSLVPVNGKICGCTLAEFSKLAAYCRLRNFGLLNEADGAARRHIKAPAEHEPVIPSETNACFYVIGLDVLGKRIDSETVHRPEIFAEITGTSENDLIDEKCLAGLLEHPLGGLKNMPEKALKIVYMTHADTSARQHAAQVIAGNLKSYDYICVNR